MIKIKDILKHYKIRTIITSNAIEWCFPSIASEEVKVSKSALRYGYFLYRITNGSITYYITYTLEIDWNEPWNIKGLQALRIFDESHCPNIELSEIVFRQVLSALDREK
jgi:hypothetical protein